MARPKKEKPQTTPEETLQETPQETPQEKPFETKEFTFKNSLAHCSMAYVEDDDTLQTKIEFIWSNVGRPLTRDEMVLPFVAWINFLLHEFKGEETVSALIASGRIGANHVKEET